MVNSIDHVADAGSSKRLQLPKPRRRVVLLGASNLSRSFPLIVSLLQELWQEPIEIMAAIGHGRSFGQPSWVFGRKFFGIFSCRLWDDLAARPALPTSALVTDIGNDLLYGIESDQLMKWVFGCVDRLEKSGAETLVGKLPTASLDRLDNARFLLFRSLLFPRSQLTLDMAKASALAINRQLGALEGIQKATTFSVKNEWYGFDPIHIRRSSAATAWREILSRWPNTKSDSVNVQTSLWRAAYLQSLPPFERAWFGISRRRNQPSGQLLDGTTVSLY